MMGDNDNKAQRQVNVQAADSEETVGQYYYAAVVRSTRCVTHVPTRQTTAGFLEKLPRCA